MPGALIIGVLGAESTGKSTLARDLADALCAEGCDAAQVPEYLREFCAVGGRMPQLGEQEHILRQQTLRIAQAAAAHAVVVADTTALMTAAYSAHVFGDTRLHVEALRAHRSCSLTLLCGLDLPWQEDVMGQRDGPQSRAPVDACLRSLLLEGGVPFSVLLGSQALRLQAALALVHRQMNHGDSIQPEHTLRWHGVCERCGDSGCEAQLLRQKLR